MQNFPSRRRLLLALSVGWASLATSAPAAVATSTSTLSLPQAIASAIQTHLTHKLARANTEEARGRAYQSAAGLLPQLTGSIRQSRVFKVNLEAQGFPANNPAFQPLIGPFNSFDARVSLAQSLLDVGAIQRARAGRALERVAEQQERLAREQVAAAAVLAYIEAQRATRAVVAARSNYDLSESLLKLSRDQHRAGVSTGVDVARAETSAALEHLRLIRSEVAAREADVRLKRVIGYPLTSVVAFPDIPPAPSTALPAIDALIAEAARGRPEMEIARETERAARWSRSAAQGARLPSLVAVGDYGFSGTTPSNTARTGSIGGRLDLPILAGGRLYGQVRETDAQLAEASARLADIQIQIEEDVRLSWLTLEAEVEETQTAAQAVQLARRELKMARDRFAAGVGDNIQLLQAQTSLDRALNDQVEALARFDTARANLAAAQGAMERFQ